MTITKAKSTEVITESVSVPCYKCKRNLIIGYTEDDRPVILHELPECVVFTAVATTDDLIDLVRRCRLALTN